MNKIRQNPKDHKRASQFTAEGYLYVQEKSKRPPAGRDDSLGIILKLLIVMTLYLWNNHCYHFASSHQEGVFAFFGGKHIPASGRVCEHWAFQEHPEFCTRLC